MVGMEGERGSGLKSCSSCKHAWRSPSLFPLQINTNISNLPLKEVKNKAEATKYSLGLILSQRGLKNYVIAFCDPNPLMRKWLCVSVIHVSLATTAKIHVHVSKIEFNWFLEKKKTKMCLFIIYTWNRLHHFTWKEKITKIRQHRKVFI